MKMLLFIGVSLLLAAGGDALAESKIAPVPACLEVAPLAVDSLRINDEGVAAKDSSLTAEEAKAILAAPELQAKDSAQSRSSSSSLAARARLSLAPAIGPIIAFPEKVKCPPLNNTNGPQELCPTTDVLMTTFYSSGRCYVLFPFWQKKYNRVCSCKECRVDCVSRRYRNLCIQERTYITSYVWAICRTGSRWQIKYVPVRLQRGECNCKSFRRRCFG